jgi:hypothetical protein
VKTNLPSLTLSIIVGQDPHDLIVTIQNMSGISNLAICGLRGHCRIVIASENWALRRHLRGKIVLHEILAGANRVFSSFPSPLSSSLALGWRRCFPFSSTVGSGFSAAGVTYPPLFSYLLSPAVKWSGHSLAWGFGIRYIGCSFFLALQNAETHLFTFYIFWNGDIYMLRWNCCLDSYRLDILAW